MSEEAQMYARRGFPEESWAQVIARTQGEQVRADRRGLGGLEAAVGGMRGRPLPTLRGAWEHTGFRSGGGGAPYDGYYEDIINSGGWPNQSCGSNGGDCKACDGSEGGLGCGGPDTCSLDALGYCTRCCPHLVCGCGICEADGCNDSCNTARTSAAEGASFVAAWNVCQARMMLNPNQTCIVVDRDPPKQDGSDADTGEEYCSYHKCICHDYPCPRRPPKEQRDRDRQLCRNRYPHEGDILPGRERYPLNFQICRPEWSVLRFRGECHYDLMRCNCSLPLPFGPLEGVREDLTPLQKCMKENEAPPCGDQNPPGVEEKALEFLGQDHNYNNGFREEDLGECAQYGAAFPAPGQSHSNVAACDFGRGVRYHCDVQGSSAPISIFGCLCCLDSGQSTYEWRHAHWSSP